MMELLKTVNERSSQREENQSVEEEVCSSLGNVKEEKWVPLKVSFVEYQKGDLLGFFFALSSLVPMILQTSFIVTIFFRRDLFTITFFLGLIVNEPLNQIVKHIIKEPRPMQKRHLFGQYGMPSSHSQHLWFFATYVILFLFVRVPEGNQTEQTVIISSLLFGAAIVSYGRIYLKYHTWTQVIAGGVFGSVCAGIWFTLTQFVFTNWFSSIVTWPISEFLLIRDTTDIPNIFWFEYKNAICYEKLGSLISNVECLNSVPSAT